MIANAFRSLTSSGNRKADADKKSPIRDPAPSIPPKEEPPGHDEPPIEEPPDSNEPNKDSPPIGDPPRRRRRPQKAEEMPPVLKERRWSHVSRAHHYSVAGRPSHQ